MNKEQAAAKIEKLISDLKEHNQLLLNNEAVHFPSAQGLQRAAAEIYLLSGYIIAKGFNMPGFDFEIPEVPVLQETKTIASAPAETKPAIEKTVEKVITTAPPEPEVTKTEPPVFAEKTETEEPVTDTPAAEQPPVTEKIKQPDLFAAAPPKTTAPKTVLPENPPPVEPPSKETAPPVPPPVKEKAPETPVPPVPPVTAPVPKPANPVSAGTGPNPFSKNLSITKKFEYIRQLFGDEAKNLDEFLGQAGAIKDIDAFTEWFQEESDRRNWSHKAETADDLFQFMLKNM